MVEVRDGVGRPWWAKIASAMGPSTVVMANIFREYDKQVPLAKDQHAVGKFGRARTNHSAKQFVRGHRENRDWHASHYHCGQEVSEVFS